MRRLFSTMTALALIVGFVGCSGAKEEQIAIKPQNNDALAAARSLVEGYANGQPMTSEVTSFPKMVEDLRAVDAARADILESGLNDLQKSAPNARAAKARELLKKLA